MQIMLVACPRFEPARYRCWVDALKIRSTSAFHCCKTCGTLRGTFAGAQRWHGAGRGESPAAKCSHSLRNSRDHTKKPATIRPALDPRQVRYQAALRPDSEDLQFYAISGFARADRATSTSGQRDRPLFVCWHCELPPFEAKPMGEHIIEATSRRVPDTLADRDELWNRCQDELIVTTATGTM